MTSADERIPFPAVRHCLSRDRHVLCRHEMSGDLRHCILLLQHDDGCDVLFTRGTKWLIRTEPVGGTSSVVDHMQRGVPVHSFRPIIVPLNGLVRSDKPGGMKQSHFTPKADETAKMTITQVTIGTHGGQLTKHVNDVRTHDQRVTQNF